MSAFALSSLIFVLTLGGILLGTLLRHALPEHHLSEDSQDVVRLGVGLIATISALVLGLLIAAAKTSFDTQSTQITQITADMPSRRYEALASHVRFGSLADIRQRGLQNSFAGLARKHPRKFVVRF